jgi:hypothetical protein
VTRDLLIVLPVLPGNAAAGKSTIAAEIRGRYGRGIALVGQDQLRRVVLREHDIPGGANIDLIDSVARFTLDRGYHTIVEGILRAEMSGWYRELDLLPGGGEHIIPADSSLSETVDRGSTAGFRPLIAISGAIAAETRNKAPSAPTLPFRVFVG